MGQTFPTLDAIIEFAIRRDACAEALAWLRGQRADVSPTALRRSLPSHYAAWIARELGMDFSFFYRATIPVLTAALLAALCAEDVEPDFRRSPPDEQPPIRYQPSIPLAPSGFRTLVKRENWTAIEQICWAWALRGLKPPKTLRLMASEQGGSLAAAVERGREQGRAARRLPGRKAA